MMNIQWYPGHMTKAKRMMQEDIKLIDIVVELLDARMPLGSKNPDIDSLAGQKYRLILLNKYDLADPKATKEWENYFKARGYFVVCLDSRKNAGMKIITDTIREACKEKIERDRKRGIINRPLRAMVVGIPNVGKSTFINSYAKKACAKVGNKPGVTKGKQWIRLGGGVELLDTPGILMSSYDDKLKAIRLALVGSINNNILPIEDLANYLLDFLKEYYQEDLIKRYDILSCDKSNQELLNDIAKRRGFKRNDEFDIEKAEILLLNEFKNGLIAKASLER